jgi:hypothetical protein
MNIRFAFTEVAKHAIWQKARIILLSGCMCAIAALAACSSAPADATGEASADITRLPVFGQLPAPHCTQQYWSCEGPNGGPPGSIVFECDAALPGTRYQLLREVPYADKPIPVSTQTRVPSPATGSPVFVVDSTYPPPAGVGIVEYQACLTSTVNRLVGDGCTPLKLISNVHACSCQPTTCAAQLACNTSIPDGCGGTLNCGGCANGSACNGTACCPDGTTSVNGQCQCKPTYCPKGSYFDPSVCMCMPLS